MPNIDDYAPQSGRLIKDDNTVVNEADLLEDIAEGLGETTLGDSLTALTSAVASVESDIELLNAQMAPWTSSKFYQCSVSDSGASKTWEPNAQVVLVVNDSTTDEVYVSHSGTGAAPEITVPGAPGATIDEIPVKVLPGEILPIIETAGVAGIALKTATGKTANVRVMAYWG